ncbi:Ff.00g102820.m01.CDS01 [Fusarium sp. VM40]|nr:Ff.00g102820.m01.CDS01 [Fusarium sp. VM40]
MASEPPPRIGYACQVTADWDPEALKATLPTGLNDPLKVQRGDFVWVFQTNQDYGYTELARGHKEEKGWVPLRILKKGVKRVDPLIIEIPAQVRSFRPVGSQASQSTQSAQSGDSSATVLQATLRELWHQTKSQETVIKEVIPGMSDASRAILFHPSAARYADIIHDCIVPQARAIMANGNFSVEQLRTLTSISDGYPKHPGIYLIIYDDFGGRNSGNIVYQTAIYIGQTINFQQRLKAHNRNRESRTQSTHYSLASKAKQMRMMPLLLQTARTVPDHFLDIAEFSFVCLFRTWYATLFRPRDLDSFGAYHTDYDGCAAFSRLMRDVSTKTGWNPGRTYGLNWNTPILRNLQVEQKWTSWYDEVSGVHVYRTRRNMLISKGKAEIRWHTGETISLPLEVSQDAGFKHGQPVHLVAEVRKRGDEYLTHPFRFCRFPPKIGRNPELEKLRSFAVKIQWLPEGETKWKQYYIERSVLWQAMGKTDPVLSIYRIGLMMLNSVEKISYSGGPDWLPHVSPIGIQYLRYFHLEQKLVLEMVQPRVIPWPQDNTMDRNKQRLLELFPPQSSPNTIIGPRPSKGYFARFRQACDMCLSQRTTTKCNYSPDDESCQCCRPLNRPCTWSRATNVMDLFVHGKVLEELGIAVNVSRETQSMIKRMKEAPIDPSIEANDHGSLPSN